MSLSKFHHPLDRVARPQFEDEVRRAILQSWASDACLESDRLPPGRAKRPSRHKSVSAVVQRHADRKV